MPKRTGIQVAEDGEAVTSLGAMVYVKPKPPEEAAALFAELIADVDKILARLERYASGTGVGGPPSSDERPLRRSCVLLIYAAWEVYIERSLIEWATKLSERDLDRLPEQTRNYLRELAAHDPLVLAGEQWRKTLIDGVTRDAVGAPGNDSSWGLNTASPKNVNDLHWSVLGFKPLDRVRWRNQSNGTVKRKLVELVRMRGDIAHTGRTAEDARIQGQHIENLRNFVARVVQELELAATEWLRSDDPRASRFWNSTAELLADGEWHIIGSLRTAHGIAGDTSEGRSYSRFLAQANADGLIEVRRTQRAGREYRLLPGT